MTSGQSPSAALGEVIRQARHLLISFEGPVCTEVAEAPAPPAPYIHDVLAACHESGCFAAVISSAPAGIVRAYLGAHDLASGITAIAAPAEADPTSIPPDPDLISQAARSLDTPPSDCVMIASTPSAIQAARAAGVPAIGYASTHDDADRLAAAGPNALIYSMAELALSLRAHPLPN